ncbi:hypothetical protein ZOSMA_218G00070 [Zostera marina]|uniref:UBC core domain-containing protein n=1 Tax=Zostera marina TaxID=29655 RepID=A0A0K9PJQ8_ZOSMR|nr:hypothetical protein ZOSMA_218G00070 [Zostera marina]
MVLDLPSFSRGRLQRELKYWNRMQPVGFKHHVTNDNIYRWIIEWTPQPETLSALEMFKFQVDFPVDYPFEPPSISCFAIYGALEYQSKRFA